MNFKKEIEDNDFLIDIIKLEALDMLKDLKSEYLQVILMDAPYQMHTDHKIRKAINYNPKWYQDLYWASGETWKRNHTIRFLKHISKGTFNFDSVYVQKLLELIFHRLGIT